MSKIFSHTPFLSSLECNFQAISFKFLFRFILKKKSHDTHTHTCLNVNFVHETTDDNWRKTILNLYNLKTKPNERMNRRTLPIMNEWIKGQMGQLTLMKIERWCLWQMAKKNKWWKVKKAKPLVWFSIENFFFFDYWQQNCNGSHGSQCMEHKSNQSYNHVISVVFA